MPGGPHLIRRSAAVAAVVVLAGCGSDTVDVAHVDVPAAQRATCAELVKRLPHSLAGLDRRDVSTPAYAAAWGDPPVVIRCGVARNPVGYRKTDVCMVVRGVDWFVPPSQASDPGTDAVATTLGRTPAIELRVPAEHRLDQAVLVDLAAPVRAHTAAVGDYCP